MSKCYLLFAEGLEECEGLVTLDILRRAGLEAYTVSIQDAHTVVGAHGVPITCDRTLPELLAAPPELVVLPGGMPGIILAPFNAWHIDQTFARLAVERVADFEDVSMLIISSSFAPMTGAVAAIAEPPQIDEPTPISVEMFAGVFISL